MLKISAVRGNEISRWKRCHIQDFNKDSNSSFGTNRNEIPNSNDEEDEYEEYGDYEEYEGKEGVLASN